MKDFTIFAEIVAENMPTVDISKFACSNGYDLTYCGMYRRGYSNCLESFTHHDMGTMAPEIEEVFTLWDAL